MDKTQTDVDARSCTNCKNCGSVLGQGQTITMVCRKNPPTVSAALLQTQQGMQWNSVASFPIVSNTDWCGSFEARLH